LKQDVAYLKGEFGRFKGKEFERTVREKFFAFFGQILRKARLIPIETILPILEEAEEKGKISESQFESILKLDLIVEGVIKSTKKPVILAVEVSYSIFEEDLKRAEERAALLAFLLEREIIPTVVGVEVKEEIVKIAEERGIFLIKTDY
ncbi:MAG: hypothetical protein RMI74_02990, partial [Thermodesulfobacterium sp.]|nr:hypothetical protein [Thermodesulfobacterium sp.]